MAGTLKRNIFQRILGICATKLPSDDGCWKYEDGKVTIDLSRASELSGENGAFRLEKNGLPERVLVFRGSDGQYHAFRNKCAHAGRRIDPVPDAEKMKCCSVGGSSYDYQGKVLSGMAKGSVLNYIVTEEEGKLVIALQ